MRKPVAAFALSAGLLASCGSSSSSTTATTKATTETTKAAVTTTATTAAPTTVTTAAKAATPSTPAAAGAVTVTLSEWKIEAGPVKAGKVTFDTKNAGQFPHELVVFKGSFADLAKGAGGSVAQDQLAAGVVVVESAKIPAGASAPLTVDLPAGKYTLVCNIVGGGVSHAAKGQVLDITVA